MSPLGINKGILIRLIFEIITQQEPPPTDEDVGFDGFQFQQEKILEGVLNSPINSTSQEVATINFVSLHPMNGGVGPLSILHVTLDAGARW